MPHGNPSPSSGDRRQTIRFTLRLNAHCSFRKNRAPRAIPIERAGSIENLSAGGCLIALGNSEFIAVGMRAQLRIDWPAKLDEGTPLQFLVWGEVHRIHGNKVAVAIHRYQFRTKSRSRSVPLSDAMAGLVDRP